MILSDRQITELCVCPTHRFNQRVYDNLPERFIRDMLGRSPSGEREYQARREKLFHEKSMVPLTEEEIAAFVPMITPFHPELIRYREPHEIDPKDPHMGWDPDERIARLNEGHRQFYIKHDRTPTTEELQGIVDEVNASRRIKLISKGLSSFGYDITLSDDIRVFTNHNATIINPKRFDHTSLISATVREDDDGSKYVVLPPNSYMLGYSREYFNLPRNVTALFIGKSTYARVGAIVNCTPGEAGWCGHLVIEVGNLTSLPMMVFVNEGIAQALFFQGDEDCQTSYGDRGGKYQNQGAEVTLAKV